MIIKLATYPEFEGKLTKHTINGFEFIVERVRFCHPHIDITYQKFTKNYSGYNSRPFVTKKSAFKTLEAAIISLVK